MTTVATPSVESTSIPLIKIRVRDYVHRICRPVVGCRPMFEQRLCDRQHQLLWL
jgi:hypothetical protein